MLAPTEWDERPPQKHWFVAAVLHDDAMKRGAKVAIQGFDLPLNAARIFNSNSLAVIIAKIEGDFNWQFSKITVVKANFSNVPFLT